MLQSKKDRREALKSHAERFHCAHERTDLRKRTVAGGAFQRVYQCLRCGEPASSPILKEKALALCGGNEPPPFDDALKNRWAKERTDALNAIFEGDSSAFWDSYDKYLASPEWEQKRQLVLRRAKGVCEGCGAAAAEHVHHINYEHVGAEFLFELVAVCTACHNRLHPDEEKTAL